MPHRPQSPKRCPSCGSRLAAGDRICTICGEALPWRLTPGGTLVESLVVVLAILGLLGGLVWLRGRRAAPLGPSEQAVADLVTAIPTPMPTFTPAPPSPESSPEGGPESASAGAGPDAPADPAGDAAPVPPPEADAPEAAPAAPGPATHVIESGDSLYAIAGRYGITLDALLAANPGLATDSFLGIGQELQLPSGVAGGGGDQAPAADEGPPENGSDPAPPVVEAPTRPAVVAGQAVTHTLAAGETLSTLADQYGVTVAELVERNGLENADAVLQVGQSLVIQAAAMVTVTPSRAGAPMPVTEADLAHQPLPAEDETLLPFPAPVPLAPGPELLVSAEVPYLRWASVGVLPERAHYVVLLREAPEDESSPPLPHQTEGLTTIWVRPDATALKVPATLRPAFGTRSRIQWAVTIRRETEEILGEGPGTPLSRTSAWRSFIWAPGAVAEE